MGKKLIITEKPSVARDFARVLKVNGNNNGFIENDTYVISWCFGHLVEMLYPESYDERYKKWHLEDLPFLPKDYKYGVIERSKDQYALVNRLLHRDDIDTVYWAGDSGKEGQTIEENIRNYGGVRPGMTELRVWIDSQTDEEILRGIKEAKPMEAYDLLGRSGIMRTIEDYSLGINFSRALSVKYGRLINDAAATQNYTAIAVGRVMTCVLGMVVNREREIRNFVETPFYRVMGNFSEAGFLGEWRGVEGSKYLDSPLLYKENGFKKEESAKALIDELSGKDAVIAEMESGVSKKRAPLLFNLAELQSECSKLFKISPAQTLDVIQELYEKKLTTYPRTDARVLTTAVAKEISKNISGLKRYQPYASFAESILNEKKYIGIEKSAYTDDSKVTDHYAIIPTGQTQAAESLGSLQKSVYELIIRRFLSIFLPPAEYKQLKIKALIDNEPFFTSAKALIKPGYLELAGIPKKNEGDDDDEDSGCSKEELLAFAERVRKGDTLKVNGFEIKEGKTSPPKRYTSGSLIIAMENAGKLIEDEELREQIKGSGIGTSATRGEILEKLVRIKYLNQSKSQIITPEPLGEMIYEVVNLSVPSLLNPEMTANWEMGLEGIINGTVDDKEYRSKLEDYIRRETNKMIQFDLTSQIAANIHQFTGKDSKGAATRKALGIKCPECGGELTTTSFGYGCSNYTNKENPCRFSVGSVANRDLTEEEFKQLIETGRTGILSGFVSKTKKSFKAALVLTKNEEGHYTTSFDFEGVEPEPLDGLTCPDCGGKILSLPFGYGCEHFKSDDPSSCRFAVGKIAQRSLTEAEFRELLTNKATQTLRGFKSKTGKKFDACLILKKDEETGKHSVAFDFENVEVKVVKDVKCPFCGGDIQKTSFGFGCANYNKDDPNKGDHFKIGTICGVKIAEARVKELLTSGKTSEISGFKSKSGKRFNACLALTKDEETGKYSITFSFDQSEPELIPDITCPKCGGSILKGHNGYRCANYSREEGKCRFFAGKIAGLDIPTEQFVKLLKEKRTDKLSGFKSKKGSSFDAYLVLNEQGDIAFSFEDPVPSENN